MWLCRRHWFPIWGRRLSGSDIHGFYRRFKGLAHAEKNNPVNDSPIKKLFWKDPVGPAKDAGPPSVIDSKLSKAFIDRHHGLCYTFICRWGKPGGVSERFKEAVLKTVEL